jgi:hypothetical protein
MPTHFASVCRGAEWKITPKMLRRLARELRLPEGELQEYIQSHFAISTLATWGRLQSQE